MSLITTQAYLVNISILKCCSCVHAGRVHVGLVAMLDKNVLLASSGQKWPVRVRYFLFAIDVLRQEHECVCPSQQSVVIAPCGACALRKVKTASWLGQF